MHPAFFPPPTLCDFYELHELVLYFFYPTLNITGNFNVISVDWRDLAGPAPWYGVAVANTKKVGPHVGQLLRFLANNVQVSANDVHLVGWSLGGQLVAFIGQEMNGTLARITSLDPAGFLFHTAPPDEKLTPDDAQFVDVIHTAGLWLGTDERVIFAALRRLT